MTITDYICTQTLQSWCERWGGSFERLSTDDRFRLMSHLSECAIVVSHEGEADLRDRGRIDWDTAEMGDFLKWLDYELTSPAELAAIIVGLALGLKGTTFSYDLALGVEPL